MHAGSERALADQTWAMTGAGGRVAGMLRPALAGRTGVLRLVDVVPVAAAHPNEEVAVADLRDQAAVERALRGADGVVHLGGIAEEADFHDLAEVNVVGSFHVLEAARRVGVRRVVCASSNRVTGFYARSARVDASLPPRPDGLYGVSKVAMEALGRLYADKFGLEVANVRIGSAEAHPRDERHLSTWLSPRDCVAAVLAAMTAPGLTHATFYAVSRNSRRWWDLEGGAAAGYEPEDDAEAYVDTVLPEDGGGPASPQGGAFTNPAYSLDRQRGGR